MVAIFLILLCAFPALQVYTNIYKEQSKVLRVNQRDHLARLIHASIIEQLYKRTISLEDILAKKPFKLAEPDLLAVLHQMGYEAFYQLSVLKPATEKGQEKAQEYLCRLTICIREGSHSSEANIAFDQISEEALKEGEYVYYVYIARKERGRTAAQEPVNEAAPEQVKEEEQQDQQGGNYMPGRKDRKVIPTNRQTADQMIKDLEAHGLKPLIPREER